MNKYYINYFKNGKRIEIVIFKNDDNEAIEYYRKSFSNFKSNHYLEKDMDGVRVKIDSFSNKLELMYSNWNGG